MAKEQNDEAYTSIRPEVERVFKEFKDCVHKHERDLANTKPPFGEHDERMKSVDAQIEKWWAVVLGADTSNLERKKAREKLEDLWKAKSDYEAELQSSHNFLEYRVAYEQQLENVLKRFYASIRVILPDDTPASGNHHDTQSDSEDEDLSELTSVGRGSENREVMMDSIEVMGDGTSDAESESSEDEREDSVRSMTTKRPLPDAESPQNRKRICKTGPPCFADSLPRKMTFHEVYRNTRSGDKHTLIQYPLGKGPWYIFRCDAHQMKFDQLRDAAGHLGSTLHYRFSRSYPNVIKFMGIKVLDCTKQNAELNNSWTPETISYESPSKKQVAKPRRGLRQRQSGTEKSNAGGGRYVRRQPGEICLTYYTRKKAFIPVLILPLNGMATFGVDINVNSLNPIDGMPDCCVWNSETKEGRWAPGYEDDGLLESARSYPTICLTSHKFPHEYLGLWATELEDFDMDNPDPKCNESLDLARTMLQKIERIKESKRPADGRDEIENDLPSNEVDKENSASPSTSREEQYSSDSELSSPPTEPQDSALESLRDQSDEHAKSDTQNALRKSPQSPTIQTLDDLDNQMEPNSQAAREDSPQTPTTQNPDEPDKNAKLASQTALADSPEALSFRTTSMSPVLDEPSRASDSLAPAEHEIESPPCEGLVFEVDEHTSERTTRAEGRRDSLERWADDDGISSRVEGMVSDKVETTTEPDNEISPRQSTDLDINNATERETEILEKSPTTDDERRSTNRESNTAPRKCSIFDIIDHPTERENEESQAVPTIVPIRNLTEHKNPLHSRESPLLDHTGHDVPATSATRESFYTPFTSQATTSALSPPKHSTFQQPASHQTIRIEDSPENQEHLDYPVLDSLFLTGFSEVMREAVNSENPSTSSTPAASRGVPGESYNNNNAKSFRMAEAIDFVDKVVKQKRESRQSESQQPRVSNSSRWTANQHVEPLETSGTFFGRQQPENNRKSDGRSVLSPQSETSTHSHFQTHSSSHQQIPSWAGGYQQQSHYSPAPPTQGSADYVYSRFQAAPSQSQMDTPRRNSSAWPPTSPPQMAAQPQAQQPYLPPQDPVRPAIIPGFVSSNSLGANSLPSPPDIGTRSLARPAQPRPQPSPPAPKAGLCMNDWSAFPSGPLRDDLERLARYHNRPPGLASLKNEHSWYYCPICLLYPPPDRNRRQEYAHIEQAIDHLKNEHPTGIFNAGAAQK